MAVTYMNMASILERFPSSFQAFHFACVRFEAECCDVVGTHIITYYA